MRISNFFSIVLLFCMPFKVFAFEYDAKNLPKDLSGATDIVIAKKVSGTIAPAILFEEIDSFQRKPINWRKSQVAKKIFSRNEIESTLLVVNSIKGEFNVGDEFKINDYWIPIELGSVQLYFLYKNGKSVSSNPCHRINVESNKNKIVELSSDHQSLINFVLEEKLSFCDSQIEEE